MKRSVLAAVAGVALTAYILHETTSARAAGGLQGQELRPSRDLESGIEAVLGGIFGGGNKPPGSIDSVLVTEDGAGRLGLAVTCSGSLDGRQVRGELLGADRRPQREFRPALSRLEGGRCEADLSFEPEGGGDEIPASAYLRVSVDGGGSGLKRVYTLGKAWGAGSDGGSSHGLAVVKVKAKAERMARALPATEPTYQPTPHPQPQPQPTPVVGGHWEATKPPIVRDRRPTPKPVVRDHRARGSERFAPDKARLAAPVRMAAAPPPVSAREVQLARARTARAIEALPQTNKFYMYEVVQPGTTDPNRGTTRPNMADYHNLFFDIQTEEGVGLEASEIAGISDVVFGDQDRATGYFYFLPRTYHLGWLADQKRYEMSVLYLASTAAGSAGEVQMAATLTAGIDSEAIGVAKALLASYCQRHACGATPELRPLPVDPSRADVKLGALGLFNIPKEKVVPHGVTSALSDFRLAWSTDAVTKENIQLVLEQSGLAGSVVFGGQGADQLTPEISVQVKLGDPGSFARPRWRRNEPWRNPTPYPVRVNYLHALLTEPGKVPTVYSWRLGGATVAPGGRVECDAREVPPWVDNKALRMWIDYSVDPGCTSCTQQVVKDITGGVTSVAASEVTFHTINPITELGAHSLVVRVRSRWFDPDGRESSEKSLVLNADNQDFKLGPIYKDGSSSRSEVLLEYFLTVVMANGQEHVARDWIARKDLYVVIGREQIRTALGFVPGERPEAPAPQ